MWREEHDLTRCRALEKAVKAARECVRVGIQVERKLYRHNYEAPAYVGLVSIWNQAGQKHG